MKYYKKRIQKTIYYLLSVALIISSQGAIVAYAADFDEQFYSTNDILFYDPRSSSCSSGSGNISSPAPTELKGESNAEKVWNYLTGRGLTPVAAAGAMGNLEQESAGFNPWAGESGNTTLNKSAMGVGFGIIQWTNTDGSSQGRRYKVMKHLEDNGVRLDATDPSQMDKALLHQLNWLWDGEYGKITWQEGVNSETTVEGNTSKNPISAEQNVGNGSTLYFHASVERSADSPKMLQERIDSAKNFLDKFGGGEQNCSVGEGGLTLTQAERLMNYYADIDPEAISLVSQNVSAGTCAGDNLRDGRLSNCVSFSKYFVSKFTTLKDSGGNGNEKVANLFLANPGSQESPSPQPFAVFSRQSGGCVGGVCYGHTGVILGINGDKAIIGEANCGSKRPGTRAFEMPLSDLSSGDYSFFNTGGSIKQDVMSGVVNG